MRLGLSDRVLMTFIYVLLALLAFSTLYPFWNAIVISFNVGADTAKGGVTFWPRAFTWENYNIVFSDDRLLNGFVVTIARTIIGTLTALFMTALLAYGMSKSELIGRKYIMIFFIITMYFGGGLIPSFLLIRSLGMIDTFLVYIIPGMISVWNMIIFRTFFRGLPAGLEESAKIDGCGNWGTFFRIVLPLSGPVLATLGLFTAVAHWNDWFVATIYISNEKLIPVQTMLRQIINASTVTDFLSSADSGAIARIEKMQKVTSKSISMATMMVATLPIIMLYPFLQRYFVKGVMIGSLKE
ncbi:carbohydrate ABC transporter permease [Cohnella phaseoli]|uniref:Putative aldouronate transport system permease protein n=1 Tax=Cohnella phaseoli TaxID=456490 RepID=A0A3D9IY34_9BACL|nr:carbohydrate ABC transporter permease [Cohnella phaseoli]RED66527.1 putative aldouronate transport system permease protein [Cohnella phaseoli]